MRPEAYTSHMDLSIAEQYIIKSDARLAEAILDNGHIAASDYQRQEDFPSLARSIIGQQLSVKSASAVAKRLGEVTKLDPTSTLKLTEADAKYIGLSRQKLRYLTSLAEHFVNQPDVFNHLRDLDDEQVIAELTTITGIGVWTAQMFLMSTLHRPDVFAPGDRGLQLAMIKIYDLEAKPTSEQLEQIASQWAPYRTTACRHLWRSLDNEPVAS